MPLLAAISAAKSSGLSSDLIAVSTWAFIAVLASSVELLPSIDSLAVLYAVTAAVTSSVGSPPANSMPSATSPALPAMSAIAASASAALARRSASRACSSAIVSCSLRALWPLAPWRLDARPALVAACSRSWVTASTACLSASP